MNHKKGNQVADNELFEQVKTYFIDSGLKPGDTLESEVVIAERFNVSRHQIRKILCAMDQAGIIERTPRRGTVLRNFDTNSLSSHIRFQFEMAKFNVAEFKEARILVERAVLPLAVRRATVTQLVKIEWTIEQMRRYKNEPNKADEFDKLFHLCIFEACGNDILKAFSEVLSLLFQNTDYRRQYWTSDKVMAYAAEHLKIVEAMKQGDAKKAVNAMDRHLRYENLNLFS